MTRAAPPSAPAISAPRRSDGTPAAARAFSRPASRARLRLVGAEHDPQVRPPPQQLRQDGQPQGLVRRPGAAQHQEPAAEGPEGRGRAALPGGLPAQDHLLDPGVAGDADRRADPQVLHEAAPVLLGADAHVGEAVEEVAVHAAGQRAQAGAVGLQRAGQQHHRHPLAPGGQHLVGPAVELDEHQRPGPPGLDQPGHGARVVEGQVVVDVGAGPAVGVLVARGREVGDHDGPPRILLLERGDQGPGLLVLADRGDVEPDAAAHRGAGRQQPAQQPAAAGDALGQLGRRRAPAGAAAPPAPG